MTRTPPTTESHPGRAGSGVDAGQKPENSPQPDVGLVLKEAQQDAERDSAIYDVPGLLANTGRLPYTEDSADWVDLHRAESRGRTAQAVKGVKGMRLLVEIGEDETATVRGEGPVTATQRLQLAEEDEAADTACLALADADLVAAGGTRPRSTSRATQAQLMLQQWGLTVVALPLEVFLVRAAVSTATRAESVFETWALAGVALFGLAMLPKLAGSALHAGSMGRHAAMHTVTAAIAGTLWLADVLCLAMLRAYASEQDRAGAARPTGFVSSGSQQPVTTTATAGPDLVVFFLVMMAAFSIVICLHAWRSSAPQQAQWLRSRTALQRSQSLRVQAAQLCDALTQKLAFLSEDVEDTLRAGERYEAEILPALGQLRADHYHAELRRRVGDPSFSDALRLVDRRVSPSSAHSTAPQN